jgi:hypothetical protein
VSRDLARTNDGEVDIRFGNHVQVVREDVQNDVRDRLQDLDLAAVFP